MRIVMLLLTRNGFTEIDVDDLQSASGFDWRIDNQGYVVRTLIGKTRSELLHRVLTGVSDDRVVDHINRNPSDNRRSNLRICTVQQNLCNRGKFKNNKSGFKGVHKDKRKWRAQITIRGSKIDLGSFDTAEAAYAAYCKAARTHHGVFARTS